MPRRRLPSGGSVYVARGFRDRLVGLMGLRALPPATGLLIDGCDSVHTAWMRMPIDVAFLGADGAVLEVRHSLRPWRVARCHGATAVLECRAGEANRLLVSARWCRAATPASRGTPASRPW